jgi:hypothetical protein
MAELLADQRAADVAAVLVAVADDDAVVGRKAQYGRQLRLAAGLQAHAPAAVADDRIDHVGLLVDLDRVDRRVPPSVAVLLDH